MSTLFKINVFVWILALFPIGNVNGMVPYGDALAKVVPTGGYTGEDYKKYLTELSQTDPKALIAKEQFAKLSVSRKKKFLFYINHPEIIEKILQVNIAENSKKNFFGGDVIVEHKTATEVLNTSDEESQNQNSVLSKFTSLFLNTAYAVPLKSKVITRKVKSDVGITLFGLNVGKLGLHCIYQHDGKKLTKINGKDAYVAFNYMPLTNYTHGTVSHWKTSDTKLFVETIWTISLIHSSIGTTRSYEHRMQINVLSAVVENSLKSL